MPGKPPPNARTRAEARGTLPRFLLGQEEEPERRSPSRRVSHGLAFWAPLVLVGSGGPHRHFGVADFPGEVFGLGAVRVDSCRVALSARHAAFPEGGSPHTVSANRSHRWACTCSSNPEIGPETRQGADFHLCDPARAQHNPDTDSPSVPRSSSIHAPARPAARETAPSWPLPPKGRPRVTGGVP